METEPTTIHSTSNPQHTETVGVMRSQSMHYDLPNRSLPLPPTLEERSWIFRHMGATITLFFLLLAITQWAGQRLMAESPSQKKTNSAIRGIRKDIRSMVRFQLEANRANRGLMSKLAGAHELTYSEPEELKAAEVSVRKLLDR